MHFSNKIAGLLLTALIAVLSIGATESAQAQPYTACNTGGVPITVTLYTTCGIMAPAALVLPPGACFTWTLIAGCGVTGIDVNGTFYAAPAALPFWYTMPPPNPPSRLCFNAAPPEITIW